MAAAGCERAHARHVTAVEAPHMAAAQLNCNQHCDDAVYTRQILLAVNKPYS